MSVNLIVLVVVSLLTKDSLFTINSGTRGLGGGVSLIIGAAFSLLTAAYWQPLQPTGLLGPDTLLGCAGFIPWYYDRSQAQGHCDGNRIAASR
jgi:hypothetical protein